jgi:hypothetical protein
MVGPMCSQPIIIVQLKSGVMHPVTPGAKGALNEVLNSGRGSGTT